MSGNPAYFDVELICSADEFGSRERGEFEVAAHFSSNALEVVSLAVSLHGVILPLRPALQICTPGIVIHVRSSSMQSVQRLVAETPQLELPDAITPQNNRFDDSKTTSNLR